MYTVGPIYYGSPLYIYIYIMSVLQPLGLRPLLVQSDLQSVGNGAIKPRSHELLPRECAKLLSLASE